VGALIFTLIGVISGPIENYFSTDVDQLNKEYPHVKPLMNYGVEFVVEINPIKPNYWVKLNEISPYAKWAIIFSEDRSFYQHEGIDLKQIVEALREIVVGARFREASTITQQMVKNIYLINSRIIAQKLEVALLAHKVEKTLSKDKILEIYLNSIEYGPGIYGIKAATQHYFNKTAAEITPKEAAFLAMLLPNPKQNYISFQTKRLTGPALERISFILQTMRMEKIISEEEYKIEIKRPLSWEK
jgi:monofunctional biosynthetic peptidoglycan transglycosylase